MPYIQRRRRRYPPLYIAVSVLMSFVISALLALILYAMGVRNEHQQLKYSMAESLSRNTDSGKQAEGVYAHFVEGDRYSWPRPENVTGISRCPVKHFTCNTSMNCVDLSRRCDGYVDCSGAEDELDCVCAFRMPFSKFCDKYPDCFDESDESFCSYCPAESYNCGNGQCVPKNYVCDSKVDCQNAMDETFCFRLTSDSDVTDSGRLYRSISQESKRGFLLRNQNGAWYPVCSTKDDAAATKALASYACVSITANPLASSHHQSLRLHRSETLGEYIYHIRGDFVRWSGCTTDEGIYVSCDDYLCGFNPKLMLPRPPSGRIVGGNMSEPGAWPWHAAIYKNGTYACGATLISDQWLLSAAHCFLNYHINYYEVQLGMLRRRSFTPHQKIYKISRVLPHKRFNVVTLEFDIVMLKVSQPIVFDFWIRPICLPRPGTVESSGSFCTAIGWGDMGETELDSDDLQEVNVPLTPSCRGSDRWLCAGYPEGGRDACQGDSGGPLMCPRSDGISWYIAGVISAGTGCARPRTPGMYTRVAYYLDWIRRASISEESRDDYPLAACPGWKCSAVGGGNCLNFNKVCDGHVDCYDAQDEVDCLNGRKISWYH